MARVKRRWTVEHKWTCSACKKVNLGRSLSCTSCGKPKGGEKYDERGAETKPAVTDARVLAESRRGKNWACTFCDYENRGNEKECGKCGAPGVSIRTFGTELPPTGCAVLPDAVLPDPSTFRSKTISKAELPPDVVEAFDSGSMTNDQMLTLLGKTSEPEPKRTFTGGDYRTAPKVVETPEAPDPVFGDDVNDSYGPPIFYEGRAEGEKRATRMLVIGAVLAVAALLIGGATWLFVPWNENVHVEARLRAQRPARD